jgi:hypothetical protein
MIGHFPSQPAIRSTIPTGPFAGYPRRPITNRNTDLDLDHIRGVVNAAAFAEYLGRPLNGHLIATWRHSTCFSGLDGDWTRLQTQLLDRLTRWLSARGVVTAFVWVRERSRGMGRHTHVLAHLGPRPKTLSNDLETYLTNTLSFDDPAGIKISYGRFGAKTPSMRAGLLRYILKGIDPKAFRYSGLGAETENIADFLGFQYRGRQGTVKIKRCGVSQNIGPKVRREAGWREQRDLATLRRRLYPDEL